MTDRIKMAIVGCGGIARSSHIAGLTSLKDAGYDGFELVAACDVDRSLAETLAAQAHEKLGANPTVYTDWQDLLQKEKLDAVDVCLPHGLHHVVGIACLDEKLDVLMEKPLAVTIRAGRKLAEAADRDGRILALAVGKRRMVLQRAVYWALNQAKIVGDPRTFVTLSTSYRPPSPSPELDPRMIWRRDRLMSGGAMILDSGFHYCDTLQYLFGEVEQVYAEARAFKADGERPAMRGEIVHDREDTWTSIFSFKSGLVGTWMVTTATPGAPRATSIIYGSSGSIEDTAHDHLYQPYHWFERTLEVRTLDGKALTGDDLAAAHLAAITPEERQRLFPFGVTNQYSVEFWDFFDSVAKRRKPEVDGWDGLRSQAINAAIYESALIGQAVKVADVYDGKLTAYQDEIDRHWGVG